MKIHTNNIKPTLHVFAGPNGSGKSTITKYIRAAFSIGEIYINADEIAKNTLCTVKEAAIQSKKLMYTCIEKRQDFSFETVLSSSYSLNVIKKAKEQGYFIYCYFITTLDPEINIARVDARVLTGGHSVPKYKIRERYYKSNANIKDVVALCDIVNLFDNSEDIFRVFKKRKDKYFYEPFEKYTKEYLEDLTQVTVTYRDLNYINDRELEDNSLSNIDANKE